MRMLFPYWVSAKRISGHQSQCFIYDWLDMYVIGVEITNHNNTVCYLRCDRKHEKLCYSVITIRGSAVALLPNQFP